ncbi:PKS_ER domain-containing protein [Psidium guajava]|nr:PKS_ER domain-containing protein [Psidium guajava]
MVNYITDVGHEYRSIVFGTLINSNLLSAVENEGHGCFRQWRKRKQSKGRALEFVQGELSANAVSFNVYLDYDWTKTSLFRLN